MPATDRSPKARVDPFQGEEDTSCRRPPLRSRTTANKTKRTRTPLRREANSSSVAPRAWPTSSSTCRALCRRCLSSAARTPTRSPPAAARVVHAPRRHHRRRRLLRVYPQTPRNTTHSRRLCRMSPRMARVPTRGSADTRPTEDAEPCPGICTKIIPHGNPVGIAPRGMSIFVHRVWMPCWSICDIACRCMLAVM